MGALRLVGHSAPSVPAADVTRPLPLATRDGALKDKNKKLGLKTPKSFCL